MSEKETVYVVRIDFRLRFRRITAPRPQSNKNLLLATSTRMAEPNRSTFGKGVPVPSNVTRISSERAEAAMLSIMHSGRNRTTKCNPLFRTRRINGHVMLSEANILWPLLEDRVSQNNQRFVASFRMIFEVCDLM